MVFDVGVIGLGAMGSAATYALARTGARVIAFDQLAPPHVLGSSQGRTRIIREAYYEHPLYVPLVRRAYELWNELERECAAALLLETGGLMVGAEDGTLFGGARDSARTHDIPHEILDAKAIAERFPAYSPPADWVGLLERRAGLLFPERCVEALLASARARGAQLRLNERVKAWTANERGVAIISSAGTYRAHRLVVAAGPWLPLLRDSLDEDVPLEIERQLSHWFEPAASADGRYRAPACPIALWDAGGEVFATIPDEGHGVKCGMHHAGSATTADAVDRNVSPAENEAARRLLEQVMPGAGGRLLESRVCLYTNTPDRHFVIDWLQGGRVLLLSPCSGHGFKFASAIGEIASQLVRDGTSWLDLGPFSLSRFR